MNLSDKIEKEGNKTWGMKDGFLDVEDVREKVKELNEEDNSFYDENIRDKDLDKHEIIEICFNYFKNRTKEIFGEKLT